MQFLLSFMLILVLLAGCSVMDTIRPVPTTAPGGGNQPIIAPVIITNNQRPVAQLKEDPRDLLAGGSVSLPDSGSREIEGIVFPLAASLVYTGTAGSLKLDTLTSPAVPYDPAIFGKKLALADQSVAFIKRDPPGSNLNRIVMLKDDVIIVVSGDIATNRLIELTTLIVVNR